MHVRLDDSSAAALKVVRADGLTDSEAVRTALRESADDRLKPPAGEKNWRETGAKIAK